jgi:DNA mismatch repair protein MutS
MRTILKRANKRSLIIGDELCSGTETVSAISLVTSGINYLSKIGCSFIFATHLHEITELDCIKTLKNVNIYHLSVKYDTDNDCLLYNRKLTKGNGNTLYGLEVAKSLDLPLEFLNFANEVRKDYIGINKEFVKTKTSVYSSDVFMDECSICKKECKEVHHIKEQHLADKNNIIEGDRIHKNRKSNLVTLCSACHDKIHYDDLKINGYIQSSDGVILDIEKCHYTKCKYELARQEFMEQEIRELRNNKGYSFNFILQSLKYKYDTLTLYRIKQICKN